MLVADVAHKPVTSAEQNELMGADCWVAVAGVIIRKVDSETLKDEVFRAKVRAEVIYPVLRAPNIEIRELDEEVLQVFLSLHYYNVNLENRDKIIMSYAVLLEAKLITSDEKIIQSNETNHLIDDVIE